MRFSHLNRCALAKPARLNGTCEIFHFILSPTVALLHTTSDMTRRDSSAYCTYCGDYIDCDNDDVCNIDHTY